MGGGSRPCHSASSQAAARAAPCRALLRLHPRAFCGPVSSSARLLRSCVFIRTPFLLLRLHPPPPPPPPAPPQKDQQETQNAFAADVLSDVQQLAAAHTAARKEVQQVSGRDSGSRPAAAAAAASAPAAPGAGPRLQAGDWAGKGDKRPIHLAAVNCFQACAGPSPCTLGPPRLFPSTDCPPPRPALSLPARSCRTPPRPGSHRAAPQLRRHHTQTQEVLGDFQREMEGLLEVGVWAAGGGGRGHVRPRGRTLGRVAGACLSSPRRPRCPLGSWARRSTCLASDARPSHHPPPYPLLPTPPSPPIPRPIPPPA
jgi:hypothetical protein